MKYLIEIHHGIGDVVQMTGVWETLYQMDKDADIGVIINLYGRYEMLRNDRRIKHIYLLNIRDMPKTQILETVWKIRNYRYDYAFFSPISNQRDARILAAMIRAKITVGEQFLDKNMVFRKYIHIKPENIHMVRRNNNLLIQSGLSKEAAEPKLDGIAGEFPELPEKTIGLCIGTKEKAKTWYLKRYMEVAEYYGKKGYHIALIGGTAEKERFEESEFQADPSYCFNYLGKLDMGESVSLAGKCDVVIGGDTGIMHAAAAMGTVCVAIFTCTDPELHAPYSPKCHVLTARVSCQYCGYKSGFNQCTHFRCKKEITVDKVVELVDSVLESSITAYDGGFDSWQK